MTIAALASLSLTMQVPAALRLRAFGASLSVTIAALASLSVTMQGPGGASTSLASLAALSVTVSLAALSVTVSLAALSATRVSPY